MASAQLSRKGLVTQVFDGISFDNPYLVAVVFAVMWVGFSYVISYIGGWARLAGIYHSQPDSFDGPRLHFRSANMRGLTHYNNVLTIGANTRGLYLAVILPFRAGHPPLFIPWEEISVSNEQGVIFSYVTFRFLRAAGITLKVSRSLGSNVLDAAGRRLSGAPAV